MKIKTDSVWEWLKRIGTACTLAHYAPIIVGLIGGIGVAMLSYFEHVPISAIVTLAIFVFASLVWALNGVKQTWNRPVGLHVAPKDSVRVAFGSVAASGLGTPAKLSDDNIELKLLLGSWTVQKATKCEPTYLAVWNFTANHRVSAKTGGYEVGGSWQLEPSRVLIDWDHPLGNGEPCYDTFHRPINATGVTGDSWGGRHELNKVRTNKITAAT